MENRPNGPSAPGTSLMAEPPAPQRRRRWPRRLLVATLVTAVAGGATVGALLVLPSHGPRRAKPPAAGPQARARAQELTLAAVTSGVPAALPEVTALIGRQESRVRARPQDARAWAVLGSAYVERGRRTAGAEDYPKAEQALRKASQLAGDKDTAALDGLAALANARRDFPTAKQYGEQALKLAPKQWTAYPPLLDAYTGLNDYKAAQQILDKLLALHPGAAARPAVMARASAAYRDRGWREDAVAQLTEAAAAARTPAEQAAYLTGVGQLAWERGDREDALRHFEAAVRLDPDQRAAYAGQGRALAALDRTTEALTAYQRALAKQPSPEIALELGELYESLGMARPAWEQYDRMQELVRQAVAAGVDEELLVGRFEADHGKAEEAVDRLQAEWRRQPGIEVADALGWALHKVGDDEAALKYASAATDKEKGGGVRSALHAFHRGMIEKGLDRTAPARRHLQEALRINPYFSPLRVPVAQAALRGLGDVPNKPFLKAEWE
ncbi:tetratricopeptide repeat protein [Streptomyces sp. NPDC002671]